MATRSQRPKLVAIVGPTASGKSDLAMRLAREFNGEIICADSRTIYKGMDIGTAKPGAAEQKDIKHWGLDLVEPGGTYSAAKFKKYAKSAIANIQKRGKLPVLVGGTGLYVDGVLYDFGFQPRGKAGEREELERLPAEGLQEIIKGRGYAMPENARNRRYLIRTIERQGKIGPKKSALPAGVILIGLMPLDNVLKKRIASRAGQIFERGIIEETKELLGKYGNKAVAGTAGIVYKIVMRVLDGEVNEEEAKELFKTADWQYARRQKTWFKRKPGIQWFGSADEAYNSLTILLKGATIYN